jgi:hypothetical protein
MIRLFWTTVYVIGAVAMGVIAVAWVIGLSRAGW